MKLDPMSIKTTGLRLQLFGVLACFLMNGCNSSLFNIGSSPLPQEANNAALNSVKDLSPCKKDGECKNFKVCRALIGGEPTYRESLSDADRENGVQERWVVRVGYIYRSKESSEWTDKLSILTCERKNGAWNVVDIKP
jgi:hypothetical protein